MHAYNVNQMQKQIAAKEAHMKTPKQDVLNMVYGETEKQQKRYEHLSQIGQDHHRSGAVGWNSRGRGYGFTGGWDGKGG